MVKKRKSGGGKKPPRSSFKGSKLSSAVRRQGPSVKVHRGGSRS